MYKVANESATWVYPSFAKAIEFAYFLLDRHEDCEVINLKTNRVEWSSDWADCE